MQPEGGRNRVIIEGVTPEIDGGRFPIKRIAGDEVVVEADILTDGHDALTCILLYRKEGDAQWSDRWSEVEMKPMGNDPQYRTFIPVASWEDAEATSRMQPTERKLISPRVQIDWSADKLKPEVKVIAP